MSDPNLVTTCNFHGAEYLIKMNVVQNCLELMVTDKQSGEEWQCSYDIAYIENLTHKTGNFKQFDIFATMLKTGLLKTSECITLDLLTLDDLESLRIRKVKSHSTTRSVANNQSSNRRYLIITYTVEFDRIHYPLPLEYCGPPDPLILQGTIRRLELEVTKVREQLHVKHNTTNPRQIMLLQKRIDELTIENIQLHEELRQHNKVVSRKPKSEVAMLQKAIIDLEKSVMSERNSHHQLVDKLRKDKIHLVNQLERIRSSEKSLQMKLQRTASQNFSRHCSGDYNNKIPPASRKSEDNIIRTTFRRQKSPLVKTTDPNNARRSRSASPRIPQENWSSLLAGKKHMKTLSLNRSSSISSIQSEKNALPSPPRNTIINSSSRVSRKLSTRGPLVLNRSRSNSVTSTTSSSASQKKSRGRETSSTRFKSKRDNNGDAKDFKLLEQRIHNLQRFLKRNVKMK